eukprot:TRINITY_DN1641_c0_g1_i1.p2 TRINITY_DN1641_c0_g1~~TRINITY_DN1641_c0_g1_i1.p2  ORF type:complete len:93 (-),score=6.27 TRINITY_DN1641_c0_g1_i1:91-369(-)
MAFLSRWCRLFLGSIAFVFVDAITIGARLVPWYSTCFCMVDLYMGWVFFIGGRLHFCDFLNCVASLLDDSLECDIILRLYLAFYGVFAFSAS